MTMKQIFTKESPENLKEIRSTLLSGEPIEVVNEYETFYGVGFDRWLREGINDIPCEIKVTSYNQLEGYPWSYEIRPKKK